MLRKLIVALLALAFSNAVAAQSFPKPPDVPAFSQVGLLYKTDGTPVNFGQAAFTYTKPIGATPWA